ncbi:MAG: DNA-3-methyladenine glycosylase 2 family protein, partial [Chloroflexota bacterium]
FYAGLILIRATGCTDQLSLGSEPRILRAVAHAYGRGETITPAELRDLAERWRPYRTWITVLMRATA